MADNDPVTQGMCAASRTSCEKLRTVENQNLLLTLRAEIRDEVDEFKRRIDLRITEALRGIGYADETVADTAVAADRQHHPPRREEDQQLHERLASWMQKNAVWLLVTLLALVAGDSMQPYATRIIAAVTSAIEAVLK